MQIFDLGIFMTLFYVAAVYQFTLNPMTCSLHLSLQCHFTSMLHFLAPLHRSDEPKEREGRKVFTAIITFPFQ